MEGHRQSRVHGPSSSIPKPGRTGTARANVALRKYCVWWQGAVPDPRRVGPPFPGTLGDGWVPGKGEQTLC